MTDDLDAGLVLHFNLETDLLSLIEYGEIAGTVTMREEPHGPYSGVILLFERNGEVMFNVTEVTDRKRVVIGSWLANVARIDVP